MVARKILAIFVGVLMGIVLIPVCVIPVVIVRTAYIITLALSRFFKCICDECKHICDYIEETVREKVP